MIFQILNQTTLGLEIRSSSQALAEQSDCQQDCAPVNLNQRAN